jgi:probable F420-dependent oxidoreductase
MKIGMLALGLGHGTNPASIREIVSKAESLGFSTLWAPEHVVVFDKYTSHYPYTQQGEFPLDPNGDLLDPFAVLAYAAACSSRIRLATGICIVPERNPLITAKEIATVDRLCGGRFMFGVGVGWSAEEYAALGVPFERRGARALEYIEVMRRIWREESTSFQGEFVRFERVKSYPKPAQGANIPIVFGGESRPALRRVARAGNGWAGFDLTPEQAKVKIQELEKLLREYGRSMSEVEIMVSPYARGCSRDDLKRYADLGVSELVVVPFALGLGDIGPAALVEAVARDYVEPAAAL